MRTLVVGVLLAVALLFGAAGGQAARDLDPVAVAAKGQELVVFEARPCPYCELFRRDILPSYQKSTSASELPIRFVDVGQVDLDRLPLQSPLTTVPTVVLMRNGREAGRITGYTGADTFFKLVAHLLGKAP